MTRSFHLLLVLLFFLLLPSGRLFALTSNEIARAIQDLGASDHKTREAASKLLSDVGTNAVPALEKAAKDADPEIRLRAAELLPAARLGLPADMPPAMRTIVANYPKAELADKQAIVELLIKYGKKGRPILVTLADSEKNMETRVAIFSDVLEPLTQRLDKGFKDPKPSDADLDNLLEDLQLFQAILPEEPTATLEGIKLLDRLGHKQQADTVFESFYKKMDALCTAHPDNSEAHNNAAWLCAVARRRLDDGLAHIEKSLAADPNQAAYLDTKAELLFQKGQKDKALELIGECLDLEPGNAYFLKQQARLKKGDPTVPPPEVDQRQP